jgi:hypothetical protein
VKKKIVAEKSKQVETGSNLAESLRKAMVQNVLFCR